MKTSPKPTGFATTALALLAAVGLLWILSLGGRLPVTSRPPSTLPVPPSQVVPIDASGHLECPATAPVAAFSGSNLFFPTNYPIAPMRGLPPSSCFATEADALTAGYALAPAPPGILQEEDVYLGPASDALTRACPRAARVVGLVVPCPTLLPLPSRGSKPSACGPPPPASTNPGCVDPYGGSLFLFWSPGDGSAVSDLIVEGFPTSRPPDPSSDASCERGPVIGVAAVGRDVGTLVRCRADATSILGGHVMLTWRHGAVTYQVALLPDSYASRRAALDVARFIRYVRP